MLKLGKSGQNTAEYALVIGLVIAAAMAMQTYVSRSLQSNIKDVSNKLVDYKDQYEPYYLQNSNTNTVSGIGGGARSDVEKVKEGSEIDIERAKTETKRVGWEKIISVPETEELQ